MLDANDIRVGSMAVVEKANDVIPYFGGVVYTNDDAKRITPPKTCPSCGGVLKSGDKLTYCMNPDCPSKNEYVLRAAAAKGVLNFDGMSTKYIDALQDAGLVNDVADFYHLSEEELTNVVVGQSKDGGDRHIGATRAKHIMSFIEASKELPFHKVLSSLAVQDLGGQTSKLLANHYQDVDAIMNASTQELSDIPGIGEKKAVNIKNGLNARKPLIKKMKDAGLKFAKTESKKTLKDSSEEKVKSHIEGKNFSISGAVPEGYANRPEWQEFIEAMGGKAQGTPNKDTDFMIGNPNDTHGKIQKAIKLGVTIISPEEFNEMIHS
jgi:DNA ligase (NAD+)